jgi:hypothetical protein
MPGLLRYSSMFIWLLPAHAADCCKNSVAVVESLQGQVSARKPGTELRAVALSLEWLPAGVTLEVGAKSSATLILLNGHRYQLGAGARATITADALTDARGPVRELPPLPPIPTAAPIADASATTSGAVRLRGPNDVRSLYPREGAAALPGSPLNLSFSAVPQAATYQVVLQDEDGNQLASWQTATSQVSVAEGILKAGSRYSWRVRAVGRSGVIGEGIASFVTISEQGLQRRADFAKALRASTEDSLALALLADLDLRLGLLREAQQRFQAALRLKPGDPGIQRARDLVETALDEDH